MAVSGSSDYSANGRTIIKGALRLLGVLSSAQTLSASEEADGLEALEMMVKSLQASGYHIWTNEEATLFLTAGEDQYSLTGARAVSDYVETAAAAAALTSATTITVDSITGIADNDVLGIQVDSDTIFWTTVNGTPSGSTVTFDDALTSDIEEDAVIYAYATTDVIIRPLRITSIRRENGGEESELTPMSRDEYFGMSNKSQQSTINQYYYDPHRATGILCVYPTSDNVDDTLKISWVRPIQDFDAVSNDADLPQEWLETLKYQLALRLAPEHGISLRRENPDVLTMAALLLENVSNWDVESVSTFFRPE